MKQIQLDAYGSADVLHVVETAVPQAGPGEVRIRVEAAGVNYSDILRRRNTYFMPTPLPYVLGAEAVGTIVEFGPEAEANKLRIGQRVLAILPNGGGYAEQVIAPAAYCVPLPPHISSAAATAIFVQGSTAHLIVNQLLSNVKDKTILVHAAAGGVGTLLTQLVQLAGGRVIGTTSSAAKRKQILALGALAAIDYTQTGWPQQVIAANAGEKVDGVLEMVGGDIFNDSFSCLTPGGSLVVYGAASGNQGTLHSERLVDQNHAVLSFNLAHYIQTKTPLWQQALGAMIELLASGQIEVQLTHQFGLDEAALAHQQIETRQTVGKVVLIAGN